MIVAFGILILFDLVGVAKRYVNNDDFISAVEVNKPFQATEVDNFILEDKGYFRVFDLVGGAAKPSYFHNSVHGYNAAELGRYSELFDFYIAKNNINVLNMLNTKYIIAQDKEENLFPYKNDQANGHAWFVKELKRVTSANEEIKALDSLDNKNKAVYNSAIYKDLKTNYSLDSLASIKLVDYKPNYLKYESKNENNGFVVFSEIYYSNGWKTFVDGKETKHMRVNYTLRGMELPAGKHTIVFKFEPEVVKTGSNIALASSILFGLLFLGGLFYEFKRNASKGA